MYENENAYHVEEKAVNSMIKKVFSWMFLALLITMGVMFAVVGNETMLAFVFRNFYAFLIGEFIVVIGLQRAMNKISVNTARAGFLGYAALNGVTNLSPMSSTL